MQFPFSLQAIGPALTPTLFSVDCPCGQRVASLGGYSVSVEVPNGMDLIAKCRCGKEHSFQTQVIEQQKLQEAQQAAAAAPAGQPVAPAAPVAESGETPAPKTRQQRRAAEKAK